MKQSKEFFFEKKNQKTFVTLCQWNFHHHARSLDIVVASEAKQSIFSPSGLNISKLSQPTFQIHREALKSFFASFFEKKEALTFLTFPQ